MPFRYCNNDLGQCLPRSGSCSFDHSEISFIERQLCLFKQKCKFKPHCIYFHPECQGEEIWEQNKAKAAKICHFAGRGEICVDSTIQSPKPLWVFTGGSKQSLH